MQINQTVIVIVISNKMFIFLFLIFKIINENNEFKNQATVPKINNLYFYIFSISIYFSTCMYTLMYDYDLLYPINKEKKIYFLEPPINNSCLSLTNASLQSIGPSTSW